MLVSVVEICFCSCYLSSPWGLDADFAKTAAWASCSWLFGQIYRRSGGNFWRRGARSAVCVFLLYNLSFFALVDLFGCGIAQGNFWRLSCHLFAYMLLLYSYIAYCRSHVSVYSKSFYGVFARPFVWTNFQPDQHSLYVPFNSIFSTVNVCMVALLYMPAALYFFMAVFVMPFYFTFLPFLFPLWCGNL